MKRRIVVIGLIVVFALLLSGCRDKNAEGVEFDAQGVRYGRYGPMHVLGSVIVDDDITVTDDLTITDDTTLTDDVDINGDIDVDGTANLDDLDVDASGEIEIDGGLTDFGGCTADVADDDNDVCVAAVLEVDGELEADGAIDADAGLTVDGGVTNIGGGSPDVAAGDNDLYVTGDLEVDTEAEFDGTVDIDGVTNLVVGTEHVGVPSIVSTAITYTAAAGGSGTVATIGDGEIWFVHDVFVNVTTNWDCTDDDCTLVIGDGNDPNGFVDLADAELQTTDAEATGFQAGWQGLIPATQGVYIDEAAGANTFIYAPSGADETIDWLADETTGETMSAGAATIYVVYTRIQ